MSLRLSSLNYETGTNHGVEHVAGLTFSRDGTRVQVGDLFTDTSAGLAALRRESHALLASDHVELLDDPSALPLTSFDEGWILTPDGLSLSWSQGEIAPMAAGVVEVTIPWSSVADVVRRDGPAGEFFR